MGKVYGNADSRNVSCIVVYINDGKVYNDSAFTDQAQTSYLMAAFESNLIVNVSGALYETFAISVSEGIATLKYAVIEGSTVTAGSAVSKADVKTSKKVVDIYAENPVSTIFGAKVNELQRSLKVDNGKILGTLFNYTKACELTNYWGTGNFVVIHFSTSAVNVLKIEAGFPEGSGLSTLDNDMNGVWKITGEHPERKFVVKTTFKNGEVNEQEFDVSGLTLCS